MSWQPCSAQRCPVWQPCRSTRKGTQETGEVPLTVPAVSSGSLLCMCVCKRRHLPMEGLPNGGTHPNALLMGASAAEHIMLVGAIPRKTACQGRTARHGLEANSKHCMQARCSLRGSAPCWRTWRAPHQPLSPRRLSQRCSPLLACSQVPCTAAGTECKL